MASEPAPLLLEVNGVSKHFPGSGRLGARRVVRAVEEVDLSLRRGQVMAIVGESGSGKTTLASLVARLLEPTAGRILLDGEPAPRARDREAVRRYRKRVQMIFQDPFAALNPIHNVRHHLMRPMLALGVAANASDASARTAALLETVGLTPPGAFLAKLPHQLSGGQRQRVVIARALAAQPTLLLADEPTSMLDVSIRMGVMNLLLDLSAGAGLGMLYITHDLAGARYVADHVAVMYAGRIVESGATEEVVQRPRHPYTKLLLSSVFTLERRGSMIARTVPGGDDRSPVAAGCPFAPRCPFAMAVCRTTMPPVTRVDGDEVHEVRCYLEGDAPQAGGAATGDGATLPRRGGPGAQPKAPVP